MNPLTADLREFAASLVSSLGEVFSEGHQLLLSDVDLVDALRAAEQLGRVVDAARLTLAGEVGRRADTVFGDDSIIRRHGCDSAEELVERATLVSGATARARLRDAKAITTRLTLTGQSRPAPLAVARAELVTGRLSADALTTIVDALRPLQGKCPSDALVAAESELVAAATGGGDEGDLPCGIHELKIMATTWALFLDPDGTLTDRDAERMRGIRISRRRTRSGLRRISGDVTDDVAAMFERLLDAHLNPRVQDRTVGFTGTERSPDDESRDEDLDSRTIDQKRHDAFGSVLAAAAASAASPTLGGAAPTLVVMTTEGDLDDPDGVAFVDTPDGQTPVPASIARHVGCHGAIHRLTLAEDGAIKSLVIHDRVFNHYQRKSIGARDCGCIIPGCTVRAAWCEVHHVIPDREGGPTGTDNGVLLCWGHHRGIDTSGWEIRVVDGMPQVRPPAWIDPRRRWRGPNRVLRRELQRARTA